MSAQTIPDIAARFWENCPEEEPFPRELEGAILYAKPMLSIVSLAALRPGTIHDWLRTRGHAVKLETHRRLLNGCLYAIRGQAFIFLRRDLTPAQRRVVLGHEFGHFLVDYEEPRERAARRLGTDLFPVLDGERQPTVAEQLSATLAGVSIDPYVHFMDRHPDGSYVEPVAESERRADALSLELLAPWQVVFAEMQAKCTWPGTVSQWQEHLVARFGIPPGWAQHYAERLVAKAHAGLTFSQAMGF
jgi:hypothetical protein